MVAIGSILGLGLAMIVIWVPLGGALRSVMDPHFVNFTIFPLYETLIFIAMALEAVWFIYRRVKRVKVEATELRIS